MKKLTRNILIAGLAGAAILSAGAVVAGGQGCEGRGPGMSGASHQMGFASQHGDSRHERGFMQDKAAQHLQDMKASLKLSDGQQAAWSAFERVAMTQAQSMFKHREAMFKDGATMLERMDMAKGFAKDREAAMTEVSQAMQALYEALTPEQRKALDAHKHQSRMHG